MSRDKGTYDRVGKKYEEFLEIQASKPVLQRTLPPQRPYSPEPHSGADMGRLIFTGIGVGIGVLLLALAALAFWRAAVWGDFARSGAATGYAVVGFFLTIAGIGGMLATLNHNFRVLARPGGAQAPATH